jgi:hypothetical protein
MVPYQIQGAQLTTGPWTEGNKKRQEFYQGRDLARQVTALLNPHVAVPRTVLVTSSFCRSIMVSNGHKKAKKVTQDRIETYLHGVHILRHRRLLRQHIVPPGPPLAQRLPQPLSALEWSSCSWSTSEHLNWKGSFSKGRKLNITCCEIGAFPNEKLPKRDRLVTASASGCHTGRYSQ